MKTDKTNNSEMRIDALLKPLGARSRPSKEAPPPEALTGASAVLLTSGGLRSIFNMTGVSGVDGLDQRAGSAPLSLHLTEQF